MHWILYVLLGWAGVSVTAAMIFGRIIRVRDEREAPTDADASSPRVPVGVDKR
ncbi:hypothetical protein [Rhodococcus sp. Q1]|uniref:hypothetical protein n=1 Tax=unclassified Rhodococcus (in: high G+C Gram-positive bacteria) TaxID=192944 RepID=UPI0013E9CAE0|nr:hypothetical protein [Rhodococcus sp. Q1]